MAIYRNGKRIISIYRKDKEIKTKSLKDRIYYNNSPWYEEYGVLADYVISNGIDNWIDTWIPIQNDLVIEMDFEYLTLPTTEINMLSAVTGSGSARNLIDAAGVVSGKDSFYGYSSSGQWVITDFDVVTNKRYKFKYEFTNGLQIMYVDGTEVYRTTNSVNITANMILTLFARNFNNVRSGFVNAKLYKFKMLKPDGTVLVDYFPLYVTNSGLTDNNGNEIPIGSYILADNVKENAAETNGAPLVGEIDTFYERLVNITFDNPYTRMSFGTWADYTKIELDFKSDNTTNKDIFFGLSHSDGYIGYYGTNTITRSIGGSKFILTPNLSNAQKGNGERQMLTIEHNSTNTGDFTFGSPLGSTYSAQKYAYGLKLYKEDVLLHNLIPVVLLVEYQGYKTGAVGFIDETTLQFFGSVDSNYNFIGEYFPNNPVLNGLTHWWDSENQSGTVWNPLIGNVNINTSDSWEDGYLKKLPGNKCETSQFNVDFTNGFSFDVLYNQLVRPSTGADIQLWSIINQSNQEWALHYTSGNKSSFYSPTLLNNTPRYGNNIIPLNEFISDIFTYNGDTEFNNYIDTNITTFADNTTLINRPGAIKFGLHRLSSGTNNQTSLIKSIRIYNRALTPEEVEHNRLYDLKKINSSRY